jgi:RNA polymerase sigma-70 factor (ECF subfamily)
LHTDINRERAKWAEQTDEELMLRVQSGVADCYDVLVDRYKVRLFNYLYRLTGNRDEAEEIAQEAFVKAYIHADKYKTIARFSTWLYTIATNLVRNRIRSRSRAPQLVSCGRAGSATPTRSACWISRTRAGHRMKRSMTLS